MLIEFSVANFRSIKDEARLSLAANSATEHRSTHVMTPELQAGVRAMPLVRTAAIYGANAAGKTNLIRALGTMRSIVRQSSRDRDQLPLTPFKFDAVSSDQPTTFEVMGIAQGVRFQYGFAATRETVRSEWLYAWPRGRVQHWFERHSGEWKLGDKLKGDREVWKRSTRANSLFLSTASALNSEQLQPIFDWFDRRLKISLIRGWSPSFSLKQCHEGQKTDILAFLHKADLAIADLRAVEKDFDPRELPDNLPVELKDLITKSRSGRTAVDLFLRHEVDSDSSSELELEEESDGTQKVFALAGPWLDTLQNGYVIVMDELHDNLHSALVKYLVNLFHDPNENKNGAQLIFSTHDTSILNQDIFRRDQIWFCERNRRQETQLFPLTDFRPRRGREDLERFYLGGRYGAVPYFPLSSL